MSRANMRHTRDRLTGKVALAITLLLLLTASSASGGEDGGARSVFATGAGNRALAIGGAYAALADDASAAVWNPGGLGFLERSELQASGASMYGLDISEQYMALALPSWRWGVGAVTLRHLGVGGIERRDERNLLIDDGLSDGETELMLSYGRAVSEGWSVGGSVKFQRQSLAGLSGSGIGLDLGVVGRPGVLFGQEPGWSERLTWGFAIRNLLEPSLRLDRDSVNDPTGVRTGLAYRHPLSQRGHFLTTLDLEKTKGSDADLHLGFEARVHPVLALRGGWNAGGLTGGAGIYWRQLVVDYVRDSNDIDAVHRFGIGLRFGSSVEERRQAALRTQEEELQAKLAATFEERQRTRVNELLQRVNVLLGQKQFDEAMQTLATVIALEPENTRVRELEVQVLRGKAQHLESTEAFAEAAILYLRVLAMAPDDRPSQAGLARCREASDRRAERTARIQQLFASALDAFAAGDPVAARTDLLRILEVDPEDAETIAMLERARGAIQARASDLLAQAQRFIDRGLLDEARGLINQAESLDPHADGIQDLNSRLRRAERQLARAVERPVADGRDTEATSAGAQPSPKAGAEAARASVERPPPLSKKRQKEIADLYKNGMSAMEEGRSDEALNYWELVWAADPGYQNVTEYLKREYLLRGLSAFSRGDLDDAVRLWEKALNFDPNDKRTIGYLARAREQQTRTREILGVD